MDKKDSEKILGILEEVFKMSPYTKAAKMLIAEGYNTRNFDEFIHSGAGRKIPSDIHCNIWNEMKDMEIK